jgi:aminopeptidase S
MQPRRRVLGTAAGVLLVACTTTALPTVNPTTQLPTPDATTALPTRSPHPTPTASPNPTPSPLTSAALRDAVEVADIRAHLEELQRIAGAHGGNRATGTTGFEASVAYVADRLAAAGYEVERQPFSVGAQASVNLLVERAGSIGEVAMLGAHLDSVLAGPGINDNGSGVATLLVVAERLAALSAPQHTIRVAFWGAEEGGPFGSQAYVDALSPEERDRIGAYLNFDMLGSPNFIRFVYDEPSAAAGSEAITALFTSHFEAEGLAWEPIDLTGHADHGAFVAARIPTGGLFSGGGAPKTDAQAAAFGGTAGALADPCSDAPCDTIANLSDVALDQMSDAVAHAVAILAGSER